MEPTAAVTRVDVSGADIGKLLPAIHEKLDFVQTLVTTKGSLPKLDQPNHRRGMAYQNPTVGFQTEHCFVYAR